MKNFIIITILLLGVNCSAQKRISKSDTTSFKVSGVCKMCEERIESALDIVGVKSAEWEKETQMIQVVFNPRKVSIDDLHKLLSKAGHRTDKLDAEKDAYISLPDCCKYDDGVKVH